ncbi:AMP-binding protein [Streptomyces sp. NPDC059578]|uniref:AMP-binding protein n=1 Tax=Streptomyces sp. NPDC059578 TaxID=3346874 RepID=UPI0036C22F49
MNLWNALTDGSSRGVLHAWSGESFAHTPWRDVVRDARGMAAELRRVGVRPGTRVAAVLTNTPDTVRGLLAIWLAGGAVASLPLPTRGQSPDEYTRQLAILAVQLEPTVVIVDGQLTDLVPIELTAHVPLRTWSSLHGTGRIEPSPPGPDDVAFIQYSSGSTSTPKGCALTTRAIEAQLEIILHLTGGHPGAETVASWLPLSHDMGMFGCLLYSWAYDYHFVLSSPERFGMMPRTWFRDMSEYEATMTAGTSTAVHLATRAQGRGDLPRPLRLRAAVIGAERVDAAVLDAAVAKFRPHGLADTAFQPAYGMAEATLAVAGKPHERAHHVRAFDADALVDGTVVEAAPDDERAVRLVSNGPALPGVHLAAGDAGTVGEITVASPSLARGYHADPGRTADRFRGGRLHTGDLGFLADGELYVVGRIDDMLSIGGRKVYASDIEAAVDSMAEIRKGCAAIVEARGSGVPRLVLMVEPRGRRIDFGPVADRAADVALRKAGVALSECLFLPPGTLPKTPSGKIQRFRCQEMIEDTGLRPLARIALP